MIIFSIQRAFKSKVNLKQEISVEETNWQTWKLVDNHPRQSTSSFSNQKIPPPPKNKRNTTSLGSFPLDSIIDHISVGWFPLKTSKTPSKMNYDTMKTTCNHFLWSIFPTKVHFSRNHLRSTSTISRQMSKHAQCCLFPRNQLNTGIQHTSSLPSFPPDLT